MEFGDLFSFDKKITPAIIKPIYWIGLILIVFLNVLYFFYGFGSLFSNFGYGLWMMVMSVLSVIFGVLGLRIASEVCLVVFEMHEKVMVGPSIHRKCDKPRRASARGDTLDLDQVLRLDQLRHIDERRGRPVLAEVAKARGSAFDPPVGPSRHRG